MKMDGYCVLDLSLFLPDPMLTQMLADHGAEVIKIVSPPRRRRARSKCWLSFGWTKRLVPQHQSRQKGCRPEFKGQG